MIKDDDRFKKLRDIAMSRGMKDPEKIFDGDFLKKMSFPCPACNLNGFVEGELFDPCDIQLSLNFDTHFFYCPQCDEEFPPEDLLKKLWELEQEYQKQSGELVRILDKLKCDDK